MKFKVFIWIALFHNILISGQYLQPFKPYFSQSGQDKYVIEQIFKFKKNGTFVDIGAHDGISYSNTYYLEKELGWTGLCIEPQDENFEKLIKNRRCVSIKGCIFNETGEKNFLKVSGPSEMLSGLLDTYDYRHLERVDLEISQLGGSREVIKIKTYNLNDLCNKNNIKHIDFLSIDTEGSEEAIIKSIDFSKINIDVIAVENNYNSDLILQYLNKKNYNLVCRIGGDEIYKKNK